MCVWGGGGGGGVWRSDSSLTSMAMYNFVEMKIRILIPLMYFSF